jgi:hypothetical protein
MKTPEQILDRHVGRPLDAALEIVRRFGTGGAVDHAAMTWMARTSDAQAWLKFHYPGSSERDRFAAAVQLAEVATRAVPPFDTWVARIARLRPQWGVPRSGAQRPPMATDYDTPVLSLVLALWPIRKDPERLPETVEALRTRGRIPLHDAWDAAVALHDYPDIAFGLLGPPRYQPPPDGWCYGCREHPRGDRDDCRAHLDLVRVRRLNGQEQDARDAEVLAAIPPEAFLREESLPSCMVEWIAAGSEPPPGLWGTVDAVLGTPDAPEWGVAVAYLCADPKRHERALSALVSSVESSEDPAWSLKLLTKPANRALTGRGYFFGPGWGRDVRARKLLPLSRALLLRAVWPTTTWLELLKPRALWDDRPLDLHPDDDHERAFVAQQEVLAEGLLSWVLDADCGLRTRELALDALERLSPRGDGSWARALSKVQEPPRLARRARDVQKAMTEARGRTSDVELAIIDSLEIFLGSAFQPEGREP